MNNSPLFSRLNITNDAKSWFNKHENCTPENKLVWINHIKGLINSHIELLDQESNNISTQKEMLNTQLSRDINKTEKHIRNSVAAKMRSTKKVITVTSDYNALTTITRNEWNNHLSRLEHQIQELEKQSCFNDNEAKKLNCTLLSNDIEAIADATMERELGKHIQLAREKKAEEIRKRIREEENANSRLAWEEEKAKRRLAWESKDKSEHLKWIKQNQSLNIKPSKNPFI